MPTELDPRQNDLLVGSRIAVMRRIILAQQRHPCGIALLSYLSFTSNLTTFFSHFRRFSNTILLVCIFSYPVVPSFLHAVCFAWSVPQPCSFLFHIRHTEHHKVWQQFKIFNQKHNLVFLPLFTRNLGACLPFLFLSNANIAWYHVYTLSRQSKLNNVLDDRTRAFTCFSEFIVLCSLGINKRYDSCAKW